MLGHVGPPVAPRPVDPPVGSWPRPTVAPPRPVDPPVGSEPARPSWSRLPVVPNRLPDRAPQVDLPVGFPSDHPVSMLQQATNAHARRFRNQMMQVAPLINDPGFHALLNAPVSLQNHAAAYQWFQGLAQQHGFPDVQSLINALIQHRTSA